MSKSIHATKSIHVTFVLETNVRISRISAVTDLILPKLQSQRTDVNCLGDIGPDYYQILFHQTFFDPNFFLTKHIFYQKNFLKKIVFYQNFFVKNLFLTKIFLDPSFWYGFIWINFDFHNSIPLTANTCVIIYPELILALIVRLILAQL